MDINNNQQTNTFTGGMNTDTSDALLKPQEYRKAVNLRPVTNTDSNDGELHLIDGVEQSFTDDHFSDIYATTSIRDIGIVVGKKQCDTGWGIYKIQNQAITRIFGPCTETLGSKLSLVTRWESNSNVKLYIADGKHKLMSINIMHTDYTGTTPPSSIEYIADTDNNVPQITAVLSQQAGNIKGVVVQYAYVLYKQYGAQSNISPLTKPISLYNENRGFKQNEYTNKSISLSLTYSSSSFNRIRIYRIAYIQNGQEPEVNIIVDQDYNGTLSYLDTGYDVSEVAYSEFVGQFGISIKPLLIESKENTLFAANIEYDQKEVDDLFQNVTVTYTPYQIEDDEDYCIGSHGAYLDNYTTGTGYGRSLMPGETYRYGIVFYDTKGRRSSVLHIEDVPINNYRNFVPGMTSPELSGHPTNTDYGYTNPYTYYAQKIGMQVHVEFQNTEQKNNCVGYEVVRCERTIKDSRTISQGIIGATLKHYHTNPGSGYNPNNRFSSPCMTLRRTKILCDNDPDSNNKNQISADDLFMFASPEDTYSDKEYIQFLKTYYKKLSVELKNTYTIPLKPNTVENTGVRIGYLYTVNNNFSSYEDHIATGVEITATAGSIWYDIVIGGQSRSTLIEDNSNRIQASYIYPMWRDVDFVQPNTAAPIQNVDFVDSPEYNKFDENESIRIDDDSVIIDSLKYVNWTANHLYKTGSFDDNGYNTNETDYFVTSGKKCTLLRINSGDVELKDAVFSPSVNAKTTDPTIEITVANIVNQNVVPYGGTTNYAKNNSIFYSFGDYVKTNNNTSYTNVFYDGDCYLGLFVYNASHTYYSAKYHSFMAPFVYAVPIYSRIDLRATSGDLYPYINNQKKYYFQDTPVTFNGYNQEHSAYLYNPAYHQTPIADKLVAIDWTTQPSEKYDTRVIYSNEKTNNEQIDSWLMFKSANYMDVDTRYGEITNLRLFKNTLVFWQEYATGMLSVNERTMIQDANATNIILGNGDVLQRYDYLTTTYGSAKNKRCETQSDTTLYWWDYTKGEILGYSGGQSVQPLSKVKNISNYVRSNDKQPEPAVTYDQDNKEVLFNVVKDGTADRCLVYNEVIQSFTSLYDLPFKYSIDISDKKYYIQNNKIFLQTKNAQNAVSTKDTNLMPYIKYVVNQNPQYNKVYDIQTIGGTLYDGDNLTNISMQYTTPLKQTGKCDGTAITNREYDFRLNVPRAGKLVSDVWTVNEYGDRLRGKTMQCELWSSSNSTDFSLQYITTKYRMSWS